MSIILKRTSLEVLCMKSVLKANLFVVQLMVFSLPVFASTGGNPMDPPARVAAQAELEGLIKKHMPPQFQEKACALLLAISAPVQETATNTQVSQGAGGAKYTFTQVSHPKAGVGWRDPSGLIWYDRAKENMNQRAAERYCNDLGLRLPTREEFEQLGQYMGASRSSDGHYSYKGFQPQVLPNLEGYWFWSSSVYPSYAYYAYYFYASNGGFASDYRNFSYSVRCVGR